MADFNPDQFIADTATPTETAPEQAAPAFDPHAFVSETYGTPTEQLKTAAEGAAEAATFGLSPAIEQAAGVEPSAIAARREANPVAHAIGEIGSLAAQMTTGVGEGELIASAGQGAAKLLGLGAAESTIAKIGSAAVRGATESALIGTGDEVARALTDPNPSKIAETALSNIGMSALLGGGLGAGFGVAGGLWRATAGKQLAGTLDAIAAHTAGGVESGAAEDIGLNATKAGIELPPAVQGALTSGETGRGYGLDLSQSDATAAGKEYQEGLLQAKRNTGDAVARAVGFEPSDVLERQPLSRYEAGNMIGNTLASEVDAGLSPLSAEFEAVKDRYGHLPLDPSAHGDLSDKIGKLAEEQGWMKSPSSDEMKLATRVMSELPLQENLGDISKYITRVGAMGQADVLNRPLSRAAGMIKNVLKEAEAATLSAHVAADEGAEAAARFADVRAAWAKQAALVDSVNDRLGIKSSTSGFPSALREMSQTDGESILRKLNVNKDANLINTLQESFPQTAQALRSFHTDQLFENAGRDIGGVRAIDANSILGKTKKLSPEMQQFLFSEETAQKLNSASRVAEALKPSSTYNYSNTARTLGKTLKSMGSSAMGMVSFLVSHNPITAIGAKQLTRVLSSDAPDAAKLALLKFLGSEAPTSGMGFKAMTDFIAKANRGALTLDSLSGSLFEGTKAVLPSVLPKKDMDKLQDRLDKLQQKPEAMANIGGSLGHYLPDHQTALATASQRTLNYLQAQKPVSPKTGILDSERPISSAQQAAYNRTLQLAEQPNLIYRHIAEGTLTSKDVQDVNAMYPALRQQMVQKVTEAMVHKLSNGGSVPYTIRRGLSLLTGQAMDSTFTPQAILAAQGTYQTASAPQQLPQGQGASKAKGGTSKLGRQAKDAQTPAQARAAALNKP
jgi:hypothetical protein